jgi:hypothetical protein
MLQRLVLVPLVLQNLVVETLVVLESDRVLMLLSVLQGLTLERLVAQESNLALVQVPAPLVPLVLQDVVVETRVVLESEVLMLLLVLQGLTLEMRAALQGLGFVILRSLGAFSASIAQTRTTSYVSVAGSAAGMHSLATVATAVSSSEAVMAGCCSK